MRNCVMIMDNEDFKNNHKKVEELLMRLPPQIQRYSKFDKTPQFLQEIYDRLKLFMNNQLPETTLENNILQLTQKDDNKDKLNDLENISTNFKEITAKLDFDLLNNKESKCLETLNRETSNILDMQDS